MPQHCIRLQEYFRDIYDHLVRLNQSIDASREMITTAISVNMSQLTVQENEVTKRLAAYAALVAVPTMVAGVYGMNFAATCRSSAGALAIRWRWASWLQ